MASQKHSIPDVHGFKSFYDVFHIDSSFQLQHIQFPVEGMPEQNDSILYTNGFKWEKSKWLVHHAFNDNDSLYRREFNLLDSTMIIETIYHQLSPMRMERRFSYDKSWQLIYYSPMRIPIKVEIN